MCPILILATSQFPLNSFAKDTAGDKWQDFFRCICTFRGFFAKYFSSKLQIFLYLEANVLAIMFFMGKEEDCNESIWDYHTQSHSVQSLRMPMWWVPSSSANACDATAPLLCLPPFPWWASSSSLCFPPFPTWAFQCDQWPVWTLYKTSYAVTVADH